MRPLSKILALPASLLVLLPQAAVDNGPAAIKKLSLEPGEKLLAEHLAFGPLPPLLPPGTAPEAQNDGLPQSNLTARLYQPAFELHYAESEDTVLRRAAEALALLERRASCPSGMNGCDAQGAPNKCCQEGTQCTQVPDSAVGHVACCGSDSCGGGVAQCPSDAVTCPAELGGGCCISGFVCQGVGCVSSAEATGTAPTTTEEPTTSQEPPETTSTEPTETTSEEPTETETDPATGGAPFRPTLTGDSGTQEGCPTGFYGCSATHGGGCCQTDRDCETHSCPAVPSTTLVSDGRTIVAPASDVPAAATSTCAGGWFLCGSDGGPVAGCCPSGYSCGTASCFSAQATQTEQVQKEFPDKDGAGAGLRTGGGLVVGGLTAVSLMFLVWA